MHEVVIIHFIINISFTIDWMIQSETEAQKEQELFLHSIS